MTAKEKLLKEAPGWSEEQAARALRAATLRVEDFDRWLDELPDDDEPLTEADVDALAEADEDIAAGRLVSHEEIKRELEIE
ncbi:MAG: hypothetical protein ACRDKH_01710 [Solirubrobacterales bacterium]